MQLASIIFTDLRHAGRFAEFPMPQPFREVLGMIPGELRRRPGTIEIPATVTEWEYGLVVVGSPTWWLSTNVPIRSFLESETAARVLTGKPFAGFVVCRRYWRHNLKTVRRLGAERGGEFLAGIHFKYAGSQVRSLLSLISYLGSSQYRDRYLGVKIPRTNIRDEQLDTPGHSPTNSGQASRSGQPIRMTESRVHGDAGQGQAEPSDFVANSLKQLWLIPDRFNAVRAAGLEIGFQTELHPGPLEG